MKNFATFTPSFSCLMLLSLLIMSTNPASGQTQSLSEEVKAKVRAEIEERHLQEQKAFIEGDCDKVVSFYSDQATLYANGRRIDSLQTFRKFCSMIPRPFRGEGEPSNISDSFHVLSENAAHFVRTIDFQPSKNDPHSFRGEVVTKVWARTYDGWKIVHLHSSVHTLPDE
jgi:ketosteroid isomerase-like protein